MPSSPNELGGYPFAVVDHEADERTHVETALLRGDVTPPFPRATFEVETDKRLERNDPIGWALLAMLNGWPYTVVSAEPRDLEVETEPRITLVHHNVSWSSSPVTPSDSRWVEDQLTALFDRGQDPPPRTQMWQAIRLNVLTVQENGRWFLARGGPYDYPDEFFNVWLMSNHARRDMLVMQPSYAGDAYTGEEEGGLVDAQGLPLYPPDYWRECRSCMGTGRQTDIESATGRLEECFFCHGSGTRGITE